MTRLDAIVALRSKVHKLALQAVREGKTDVDEALVKAYDNLTEAWEAERGALKAKISFNA